MHQIATRLYLFALSVVMVATQTLAHATVVNPVREAVQTVHELTTNGHPTGWCSAVAIAPDTAWTAAHCREGIGAGPVTLLVDGKALPVTDWRTDFKGLDFAVITVPGLRGPYAERLPSTMLESFADVFTLGYPLGGELTLTTGFFVGWLTLDDGHDFQHRDMLAVTTPVKPGNSGGGVFMVVDSKAYLIGILVAALTQQPLSFATDVTR